MFNHQSWRDPIFSQTQKVRVRQHRETTEKIGITSKSHENVGQPSKEVSNKDEKGGS